MIRRVAYHVVAAGGMTSLGGILSGCSGTLFEAQSTDALRQSVIDSARRETAQASTAPDPLEPPDPKQTLEFEPERLTELETMAGPDSYDEQLPPLERNLLGEETEQFRIDLQQAIARAVQNNLNAQLARFEPAISEASIVAAQAAFDWLFFADFGWGQTDEPARIPVIGTIPVGADARMDKSVSYSTGIRKTMTTGGQIEISQGMTYLNDSSPGVSLFPDPSHATFLQIDVGQPLLRGFGSEVNLAQVRLNQNAERRSIHRYHLTLIEVVTQAEIAYWRLAQAQANLRIFQRLLERGIQTRDVLDSRRTFDVKPAEFSDAVATVERRRADIIRAENELRLASDRLKAIINDPELTVGNETQLVAVDVPVDEPLIDSLLNVITTAIRNRPEIQIALLDIDDSSVRQIVARNGRLPLLDVAFSARFQGLADDVGDSYGQIADAQYVNMLLNVLFEQPIGNRAGEAAYRSAQLQRMQATVGYRRAVQDVVLDVKVAVRNLATNYRLIEQTRVSRLAATENLRTLLVQEQTIQSLTPEFLNIKFQRQDSLASAEIDEYRAMVDYNTAIADLARAMGKSLERNQIELVIPDAGSFADIKPDIR